MQLRHPHVLNDYRRIANVSWKIYSTARLEKPGILHGRSCRSPILVLPLAVLPIETLEEVIRSAQSNTLRILAVIFVTKTKGDVLVAAESVHFISLKKYRWGNQLLARLVIHVATVSVSHLVVRVRIEGGRFFWPQCSILDSHREQIQGTVSFLVFDLDQTPRMLVEPAGTLTKNVLRIAIQNEACNGDVTEVKGPVERSPAILRILYIHVGPRMLQQCLREVYSALRSR